MEDEEWTVGKMIKKLQQFPEDTELRIGAEGVYQEIRDAALCKKDDPDALWKNDKDYPIVVISCW